MWFALNLYWCDHLDLWQAMNHACSASVCWSVRHRP
jgi:hypothetical protein